jgi:hypothetical protein
MNNNMKEKPIVRLRKEKERAYYECLLDILNNTVSDLQEFNVMFKKNGLDTIIHIASITFRYTKCIEKVKEMCELGTSYYIEFIKQINTDNIRNIIQLSINDSIIFVYKKTIYTLDKKPIIDNSTEEHIFSNINTIIRIFSAVYNYNEFRCIKHKKFLDKILLESKNRCLLDIEKDIYKAIINNDDFCV